MPLVSTSDLAVHYGADIIFSGVNLDINERARIGIVGPNGGGKTSLLKVLVGHQEPSEGRVARSTGIQVGYVPQEIQSTFSGTLREEVLTAFEPLRSLEDALETSSRLLDPLAHDAEKAGRRYAALLEQYEALGGYSYERETERMVDGLGLKPDTLDSPAASASGGERTRAALAKALLGTPDLLVLDEPTNYLDLQGVTWLERYLTHFAPALVVVSHDRYFLDEVATQIWEIDHGRLNIFPGNFSKYRVLKAERDLRRAKEYEAQQEFIAKEQAFIDRYRAGQRSREAKGRETRLKRLERIDRPDSHRSISLSHAAAASRTAQVVLSTSGLKVGYTDGDGPTELLQVPDLKLARGSRTAVIGDNGTGKTTFVRTVLGLLPPLAGSVGLGQRVKVGYYTQGLDALEDEQTVLDSFLAIKNMPFEEARFYLARFLFQGDDVFREVGVCSGGEKSRLALARLLITEPNLLVLDEPTTHFDIPSREALEQVLMAYPGTILLVSHDRHLVSLLAESLLITAEGKITLFPGTFQEWTDAQREAESAAAAVRVRQRAKPVPRPTPARTMEPKRRNPAAPIVDIEKVIIDLEDRLKQIEEQLQKATLGQDLNEMKRLADEHTGTEAELKRQLEDWED